MLDLGPPQLKEEWLLSVLLRDSGPTFPALFLGTFFDLDFLMEADWAGSQVFPWLPFPSVTSRPKAR